MSCRCQRVKDAFYVDDEMIRDAVNHQMSFNIIHLETLFKVDIFVAKDRDFDRYQIERRTAYFLSGDTQQSVYVASAEDTILAKLEWYRMGGEVSDRQWRDILGIMKVQANRLDMDYLRKGSRALLTEDLLDKAINEALL